MNRPRALIRQKTPESSPPYGRALPPARNISMARSSSDSAGMKTGNRLACFSAGNTIRSRPAAAARPVSVAMNGRFSNRNATVVPAVGSQKKSAVVTNPYIKKRSDVVAKPNSDGWLSTRRKGKDDVEIKDTQRKVKEARKRPRAVPAAKKGIATKRKAAPLVKKKRRGRKDSEDESSEDGSSMDDFIVGSDDEGSYDEGADDSSSSEEEVVDSPPRQRNQRTAARRRMVADAAARRRNLSQDPMDDEDGDYAPDVARKSRSRPIPSKRNSKRNTRNVGNGDDNEGATDVNLGHTPDRPCVDDFNEFEDFMDNADKNRGGDNVDGIGGDDNSDDDDLLLPIEEQNKKKKNSKIGKGGTGFLTVGTSVGEKGTARGYKNGRNNGRVIVLESEDDEEVSSVIGTTSPYFKGGMTASAEEVNLSDEDDELNQASRRSLNNGAAAAEGSDDLFEDDDETENMAISAAIQESLRETGKKGNGQRGRLQKCMNSKSLSKTKNKKEEDRANFEKSGRRKTKKTRNGVMILDSSDEEERSFSSSSHDSHESDDGAGSADDYSEEVVEAENVLQKTGELSTRIVSAMARFCKMPQKGENGGALTVHALADGMGGGGGTPEGWITAGEVEGLCPGLVLADYQLIGLNWMATLHSMTMTGTGGKTDSPVNGVLADEMGLGKTVQTIAFLAWLMLREGAGSRVGRRPHIIIVPASVLNNWMNELKKFCPQLVVVKYHGTMVERAELQERLRRSLPGARGGELLDVVLTTYSYFSTEKPDDRVFLKKFHFDYMIVDEAHCLKNPAGMRYKNMMKFSTSHKLLLTGTPVQNSPQELMSLLCFLMPLFKTKTDEDGSGDGGAKMLSHFVTITKDQKHAQEEEAYQKLKQLLAPFVLRRRKEDVLGQLLPPKVRKVEFVPFSEKVRLVYDGILARHLNKAKGIIDAQESKELMSKHIFTSLRKAANHPLLLRSRHTSPEAVNHLSRILLHARYFGNDKTCTQDHVLRELVAFSDYDIHMTALEIISESSSYEAELSRYILNQEDMFCSPKFVRLRTLLPELISEGHRILIFSQWTRCLDLLGCLLESMNLEFFRLDGQTNIQERQKMIDEFNNDDSIPVFLLSTRAGGMGINLTSADTCIMHDLDFNPFNDLQAEDRCHRIGQTKPVTVIKMITEKTVDSDIYSMQERKAKMNAAILGEGPKKLTKKDEKETLTEIMHMAVKRFNDTHS